MDLPFISVVVPTYNEEENISSLIESLLLQDYPKDRYEIIIVDNNSSDKTFELALKYPVKALKQVKKGRPATINMGILASKGEIIANTDADCIVDKYWLSNIARCFNEENAGIVAGPIKKAEPRNRLEKSYRKRPDCSQHNQKNEKIKLQGGANLSFRRDVLFKVGLFDEKLLRGQDADICTRIQKQTNYRLIYHDSIIIYHRYPHSVRRLMQTSIGYSFGKELQAEKSSEFHSLFGHFIQFIRNIFYSNTQIILKLCGYRKDDYTILEEFFEIVRSIGRFFGYIKGHYYVLVRRKRIDFICQK